MAKESVESLRECVIGKDEQGETRPQYGHTDIPKTLQSDALSISSGSFSELDSEDQAILNESDTELSDHEYYVVNLPECFNLTTSYIEADRPDSPDFLTADEDDRTTAVASESQDDQRECLIDSGGASASSNASQEGSHSRTIIEVFPTRNSTTHDCKFRSQIETSGYLELESNKTPMPHPPTETKPFMEIPTEALRTNLTYTVQQVSAGNTDHDDQLQEEEQNKTTWVSGSEDMQGVVCEQPSSAQHKELGHTSRIRDGGESGEGQGAATDQIPESRELPVDLVGALPDELVSIIPEDLVRGVWNTARTFITRINQVRNIILIYTSSKL
ncbi:uncharacterized protein LOC121876241 [Homarus americanus]|uniref:uncharacterized protein LOC121876241 n=1 Tax=Homarus americanus TaxID=6706 RepID=UPI001C460F5F|nr:uncharacterized protein LOC121876241 [Homarus americanus]